MKRLHGFSGGLSVMPMAMRSPQFAGGAASFFTGAVQAIGGWVCVLDPGLDCFQDSGGTTPATADGDPVGKVTDQSGSGNHGTQTTSGDRPLLKLAIVNGSRSVLRFDGSDDSLWLPDLSALTAGDLFIVLKLANDPPSNALPGSWRFGSGSKTHVPFSDGTVYDSFGTSIRRTVGNPATSFATAFRLYNTRTNNTVWAAALDTSSIYSDGGDGSTSFSNVPIVGQTDQVGGAGNYNLEGDIAALLLNSTVLGSTDRATVEQELKSYFGLTGY